MPISSLTEEWLQLYLTFNASQTVCRLINRFGGAGRFLNASPEELLRNGVKNIETVNKLRQARNTDVQKLINICKENGFEIITPDSPYYPPLLKTIPDYPLTLFAQGKLELLKRTDAFSVVGTRSASDFALRAAFTLSGCLSLMGFLTVSGGALGIDAAAHEGALCGKTGTVAVLGSGLGSTYLAQNELLRRRIAQRGVLISELYPLTQPTRYTFPKRNRIIAGMSAATVVAESGLSGGSMITADYAQKYKRYLMCPSPEVVQSDGCDKLLGEGAVPLLTPRDALTPFGDFSRIPSHALWRLDTELKNNGIHGPHVARPSTLSIQEYALYNGVPVHEACMVLGFQEPEPEPIPENKPQDEPENTSESNIATAPVSPQKKQSRSEKTEASQKKAKNTQEKKNTKKEKVAVLPDYLTPAAVKIYGILTEVPQNFDELQFRSDLPIQNVMVAVTELELEGLAVLHPGNRVTFGNGF